MTTRTAYYMSGKKVTDWHGNTLMAVTEAHYGAKRWTSDGYWRLLFFRAVDAEGAAWRGWGSSNHDLVTLRRVK